MTEKLLYEMKELYAALTSVIGINLALLLYSLDYQGMQRERLVTEEAVKILYRDNHFVDVNKMICATVYSPDNKIFNKYLQIYQK